MAISDIEVMKIQAETLFVADDEGRLLFINDPYEDGGGESPIVFVGLTRLGSVARFSKELPDEVCRQIDGLIDESASLKHLNQEPPLLDELLELVAPHSRSGQLGMGPAYRFPETMPVPTSAVKIDRGNSHVLKGEFADLVPDLERIGSFAAVVEDDRAVSVCHSSRRSPKAEEAGVFTIPTQLGRGYATDAVARWARVVVEGGRIPLYSTSWDNKASQRVAEKLGLVVYGVDLSIS